MESDPPVVQMPERVGRYELLIPIGTGGMGSVYLARAEVMPGVFRDVAVKLMHPQLRADERVAEQLLQEAKLAASIRHPNVVSVLEAGPSPHGIFLALDYVEGDTLSGVLRATLKRKDELPLAVIARIVHDALTGLHAAHELRDDDGRPLHLVHRDFSPQNILVGLDGLSRLTDFGIAKALGQLGATATGIVKGKVGYMAPEQARGESLDRRCDVWAAGVVVWELLAGKRLFRGANEAATLYQVLSATRPPPLSDRRDDVPREVEAVLARALEPTPSRRLATALALRQELDRAWGVPLAERDDVGLVVREAVGDRIATRRDRAADVESLRRRIEHVSASAGEMARDSAVSSMGTPSGEGPGVSGEDSFEEQSTRAALSAETRRVRGRSRYLWMGAALAVGGVAAFGVSRLSGGAADGASTPAAGDTGALEPAPAPAPEVVPTAVASASAPIAPGLQIAADRPIRTLTLGSESVALGPGVTKTEWRVESDARELEAVAQDGAVVRVVLAPDQREVELKFPAAPRRMPVVRPLPKPSPQDNGPGIVPVFEDDG